MDALALIPIVVVVIIAVVFGLVFLPMIRGSMRSSKLMQTGVSAQAQILKVWQTGMSVNDQPQLGLLLQVQPTDGTPPFQAEAKKVVPLVQIPQFQPGGMLEVKYDPANPKEVAIAAILTGGMGMMGGMQMGAPAMMAAPAMNPQATEQMLMQLQAMHEQVIKNGAQAHAKVVQYMPMNNHGEWQQPGRQSHVGSAACQRCAVQCHGAGRAGGRSVNPQIPAGPDDHGALYAE